MYYEVKFKIKPIVLIPYRNRVYILTNNCFYFASKSGQHNEYTPKINLDGGAYVTPTVPTSFLTLSITPSPSAP